MKKTQIWLLGIIILLLILSNLLRAEKAGVQKLTVFVPCGMTQPYLIIEKAFQAKNPQVKLRPNIESMSILVRQVLKREAKPSVFLSMGDLEISKLEEAGLIVPGSKTVFAYNSIVLITPENNPGKVKSLKDLASDEVKTVCFGDPKILTGGQRAQQALDKLGIWKEVEPKLVKPEFGRPIQLYAKEGKVQAAITYKTCLFEDYKPSQKKTVPKGLKLIGEVPKDLYEPIQCCAVIIKGSPNQELAKRFIKFLLSEKAQKAFEEYKFIKAKAKPTS